MGLPLCLDIFGEDQDSIFLLLEQKDPAFGGEILGFGLDDIGDSEVGESDGM